MYDWKDILIKIMGDRSEDFTELVSSEDYENAWQKLPLHLSIRRESFKIYNNYLCISQKNLVVDHGLNTIFVECILLEESHEEFESVKDHMRLIRHKTVGVSINLPNGDSVHLINFKQI